MRTTYADRRRELRRNLFAMNADGFSFSVMVGIGETYLPAFVLARGMGELTAALIATVPLLLGSLLQLAAPLILRKVRSYRQFVVGSATLQATSLLILVGMALVDDVPAWTVFIPATIYWAAGLATGPAWNAWVEQLVPEQIRSGFFARRARFSHIGVLIGLIAGGLLLRWSIAAECTVTVFGVMFGIGAVGRFFSAYMLGRQTELIAPRHRRSSRLSSARMAAAAVSPLGRFQEILNTIRHPGNAGRLVIYLMAVQTAVHISGPYFTPFMFRSLKLSPVDYMFLLSVGFVGKMLALPWAGRLANRAGADRLLVIGSIGIVPISSLWLISQQVWFLACAQLISGLVWGCYELAMLLQFFRQIPEERRVAILTMYNLGNSAAMVVGSLLGAAVLTYFGSENDPDLMYNAYLTVFFTSSLARGCALLLLPGRRRALATTREVVRDWMSRTIAVRPMAGSVERPVFAAMQPVDGLDDSSEESLSEDASLDRSAVSP